MTDDPRDKFRRLINSDDDTPAQSPSQPVPPPDAIPPYSRPAVDRDNMPLPRRVTETDVDGTRVTPAAYNSRTNPNRRTGARTGARSTARPAPAAPAYRFS